MSLHKPVLLKETVELLNIKEGSIVVDATLGGGGHSREILRKIGEKGTLVSIDADNEAIERFKFKVQSAKCKVEENLFLVNGNFANLGEVLKSLKIEKVDAILADLGWSSDQLEGRGMSFLKDEPLDMRFDSNQKLTARGIVNEYSREDLERILKEYGEERFAKNISKKIVEYRKNKIIETTGELADIIKSAVPEKYKHGKINSATRTFQAIRIEVNGELDNLKKFIPKSIEALIPGGRLAIISFHSLEDRIVKNIFRENAGGCICPKNFPQCVCGKIPKVKIITKKPIVPEEKELESNPRARSAKLRICEKI